MRTAIPAGLIVLSLMLPSATTGQGDIPFHGDPERFSCTIRYTITAKEKTDKVVLTTLVPRTIAGKQKISNLKYSRKPDRDFEENGTRYAIFTVLQPKKPVDIRIEFDADLFRYDFAIASKNKPQPNREDLTKWLIHESRLERNAVELREPLKEITGRVDLEIVGQVMSFLQAKIKYSGHTVEDRGALGTLKQKQGDCGDFSDLFVAMCRAKGVPARICDGYVTAEVAKGDIAGHTWAEVFLKDLGWVPIDPLHVFLKSAKLKELKNHYLYMTNIRNDPRLENNHFCVYRYYGSPIVFHDSFVCKKR